MIVAPGDRAAASFAETSLGFTVSVPSVCFTTHSVAAAASRRTTTRFPQHMSDHPFQLGGQGTDERHIGFFGHGVDLGEEINDFRRTAHVRFWFVCQ